MGGSNIYAGNDITKAPWGITYDADGTAWVYAIAAAELTAKTPIMVISNEFGHVTAALGVKRGYVGIPEKTIASGELARLQIGGKVVDMITASLSTAVGHAMTITSGAVADAGSDYTGAVREFCANITATTTSTTHTVQLVPDKIVAS